jgi:phospholipid/cholesterol/gamma-HCH transport system ATP-binding protein
VASQGTPQDVLNSTDPLVYQYVNALSEGPVRFHYPALSVEDDFGVDPGAAQLKQQKQVGVTR